ncbi:hypothetical protein ACHAW6_009870 [Cyclotella cf. meneghiniana]
MRCHHSLLFLLPSAACAIQSRVDISPKGISDSIDMLKSMGVLGVENLCFPTDELLPLIPKCKEDSPGSIGVSLSMCDDCCQQERRGLFRGAKILQRNLNESYEKEIGLEERRLDNEADEIHNAKFYIINIGGILLRMYRSSELCIDVFSLYVSIIFVALIAGMLLGFLTLDPLDLRIKMQAAIDPAEREAAAAIFPIVNQNHRLLVTLLLMNAIAYECLPLFLDRLMPTYLTIVFSVTVLLIFGEIIPSAIFTVCQCIRIKAFLFSRTEQAPRLVQTALNPISSPLVKLMDRLVPDGSNENDEEYNRAELSALVRIQYEERMKAQKQRDLANTLNERGGLSPLNNSNARRRRSVQVNHMANQLSAEKQRRSHEDYHSKSTRSWRRLKEELIAAADKHLSDHTENAMDGSKNHKRTSSGGFRSLLNRIPSLNSVSSTQAEPTITPALEQIAPPLEKTEVKVVEGALNMKTMCALDVYTPLRMIFAVPEDLLLTKEAFAEIYGQGYSRVPVYEAQQPPNENRIAAMKGILMTRQLIMIDWEDERAVSTLPLYIPPCVSPRMNLVKLLHLLRKGGSLMAFVCAGPHIAERALSAGKGRLKSLRVSFLFSLQSYSFESWLSVNSAIPVEAGFMGIVTLQDVLESVLQERIYDEEDIAQRHLASAVLTQWAASLIQKFMKRRKAKRSSLHDVGLPTTGNSISDGDLPKCETTPLLKY